MKVKTIHLIGPILDYAVALCLGYIYSQEDQEEDEEFEGIVVDTEDGLIIFTPSTDWNQGGPIIEKEDINLLSHGYNWYASTNTISESTDGFGPYVQKGKTPLIAAMRCYVADNLKDEVEIPDELFN